MLESKPLARGEERVARPSMRMLRRESKVINVVGPLLYWRFRNGHSLHAFGVQRIVTWKWKFMALEWLGMVV